MDTKLQTIMKNRVPNYITKVNDNQINEVADRKSFNLSLDLCEKSMAELKKIYWFEKELLIAIPILISNATSLELVQMLAVHDKYLREHIKQLEENFPFIDTMPLPKVR